MKSILSVGVLLLYAQFAFADEPSKESGSWITHLISGISGGTVFSVLAYAWKWHNRPRLNAVIEKNGCIHKAVIAFRIAVLGPSPDVIQERDSFTYFRYKIVNVGGSTATNVRATLTKIEKYEGVNNWVELNYHDFLSLSWAYRENDPIIQLPVNIPAYLDVCKVSIRTGTCELCTIVQPPIYYQIINTGGNYRFHILLSGDNVKPKEAMVMVTFRPDSKTLEPFNLS